jgi:hypothetical protein
MLTTCYSAKPGECGFRRAENGWPMVPEVDHLTSLESDAGTKGIMMKYRLSVCKDGIEYKALTELPLVRVCWLTEMELPSKKCVPRSEFHFDLRNTASTTRSC